ncbi:hypothetical protein C8Q75DRAFT_794481 [Abortiporus biennis]|nr:hypothetical protein C8Q75DRAFT_794481 [Abortiporus biennis]
MHVPSLNMSNLLANDAPLLSPIADQWDHPQFSPTGIDSFASLNFPPFGAPSSPPRSVSSSHTQSPMPAAAMLRNRYSPDGSDSEQMCIATHQVFDFAAPVSVASSPMPEVEELPSQQSSSNPQSRASSLVPSKRPSTSTASASKKPRAERVTTKDFIPPDVTGLSKREARLVKNRAAAFLSRQRKREEFENMEIRVAELEQENARLQALASGKPQEDNQEELVSEVEQLRRQLAAAQERERELSEKLSREAAVKPQPVKMETVEPILPISNRSASAQPQRSGASLGLMVLLCALPTLLSVPTQSTLPTTFSLPLSGSSLPPSSAFDVSSVISHEYDWIFNSGSSIMDLDVDDNGRIIPSNGFSSNSVSKKLEFVDVDSQALGLNGLDISFDAMASQDGKIRVRIHPPPSTSSSASTTAASSPEAHSDSEDQTMWGGSETASTPSLDSLPSSQQSIIDSDPLGPFLGYGGDYGSDPMSHLSGTGLSNMGMSVDSGDFSSSSTNIDFSPSSSPFDFGSHFGDAFSSPSSALSAGRRRVRIALKSLPGQGSEGGEWEVQVC